jgi:hypothetical protein
MRHVEDYLTELADVYPTVTAFFAWEEHMDRVTPHAHGLVGGLGDDIAQAVDAGRRRGSSGTAPSASDWTEYAESRATDLIWRRWFTDHGLARIEAVRDGNAAAGYAAKYCMKELGPWKLWTAGELRDRWESKQYRKARRRR